MGSVTVTEWARPLPVGVYVLLAVVGFLLVLFARRLAISQQLRRWVIYAGTVEASRVPPDWHGWLHHTVDEPPTAAAPKTKPWEARHKPNLTGTADAYRPDGSLWKGARRPHATGDYEAWRPN